MSVIFMRYFFLILFCLNYASISWAADVEQYWTTAHHFNWVDKLPEASHTPLTAYINGAIIPDQKELFVNYKGVIHARILLEHMASNKLEIKQGDTLLFTAELFQASNFEAETVPDDFDPLFFHTEEKEESCQECHRLKLTDTDLKPNTPNDSLCYSCHSHSFTDLKYQHSSAGIQWLCLRCHNQDFVETESSDTRLRFSIAQRNAVAPLCYQCHPSIEKEAKIHKFVHGPIGMEGCNMCHNPHGSQVIKLLEKDATRICVECHEAQYMFERPIVHAVMKKEGCPACHDAHSSNFRFQLVAETNELCYKCHPLIKKQKNNHPINGHPVSRPKNPSKPDEPFSCVSCHNPHSTEYDKLLNEEDAMSVCISCHPMGE